MDWVKLTLKSKHKKSFENANVFTCSLFNMKQQEYKTFKTVYYDGLINVIGYIKKYYPEFKLICYLDYFLIKTNLDLVTEFLNKYEYDENILIYFYFIPNFVKPSKDGHIGTVGTIVRFIPFFENKYNVVWCTDVDLDEKIFRGNNKCFMCNNIKYYNDFIKSDAKIFLYNYLGYETSDRFPLKNKYIFIGNFIIMKKIKFTENLLNKFMSNKVIKFNYNYSKSSLVKQGTETFPYGADEYFLNKYLYKYIEENAIKVMIVKNMRITSINKTKYCDNKIEQIYNQPKMKDLIKKINKTYDWNEYKKYVIEFVNILFNQFDIKSLSQYDEKCQQKIKLLYDLPEIYNNLNNDTIILYYN